MGDTGDIERRNAETADRMATATERMATGWWWQTTVLVAIIAVVAKDENVII